jgi:hypothetical protein
MEMEMNTNTNTNITRNIDYRSVIADIEHNEINRNSCLEYLEQVEHILKDMNNENKKKYLEETIEFIKNKIEQNKKDIFNSINNKRSIFSLYSFERISSMYYMQLCYFKGCLQSLL